MTDCKGAGPESAATDPGAQKNVGGGKSRSSKPQPSDPQAAPKSWRDVLPIHPAADLFPLMVPDELRKLGEDIKKNGLASPIAVVTRKDAKDWHYQLLDGRNRLDAMEMVGVPFELMLRHGDCVFIYGDDQALFKPRVINSDPYVYVISANIHRRHLTAEQKRELIANVLKAQPEKSDRQIAETVKASPTTVGTVRAKMEATGDVSKLDTRTDSKGRQQPARKSKSPPVSDEVLQQRAAQPPACLCPNCACSNDAPQETKPARDDIGGVSNGEIARKDARIDELQAEKRRLEIENVGLRSEVEEAKASGKPKLAPDGSTTLYCSFCGGGRNDADVLIASEGRKPVCICNACVDLAVDIIKKQKAAAASKTDAEAAPPASDDGLDIPDWRGGRRHDRAN